jgi:hypothetical protein
VLLPEALEPLHGPLVEVDGVHAVQVLHVAAAVRQLDEALEHAGAHLRVVGDAPISDATQRLMRLNWMINSNDIMISGFGDAGSGGGDESRRTPAKSSDWSDSTSTSTLNEPTNSIFAQP